MLRKFASMPIISAQSGKTGETTTLRRSASRAVFNYEPRDGYIYVRSRAISSRCNDNYDEFPADEIKKGYKTFIGKPVFVNHHNDDHRRARGFIIDAALHEDTNPDGSPDTWAEVLMEVDAKRFPKLAKAVLAGEIDRTSMGVDVDHSICAACNNKATRPDEYCQHVPGQKGNRLYRHTASGRRVGILIREACYGLHFFENSLLVEDPADPTAFAWVDKPGRTASKTASGDVDKYLHITDNPHFSPDPSYAPANNTTLGGSMERGLCVSKKEDGVGGWARGYGYMRPYVAEIHVPKGTDTGEAGYGGERFIKAKDFDKAKVHRVIPIDEHVREHYRRPGWIESHLEEPHDDRKIVTKGLGYRDFEEKLPQGYRYSGPDVRDMPSSEHRKHYERWKRFMTTGGNSPYDFGENEFDDKRMSLSAAEPSEHDYDDEGQFIMRDKHGNETGRKWAKLHTALPGTSSEDHDRGRHKGRDAAACEQCGSDIYLVQDGSPGGSWQHDIDSGAGIPHKARPVIGNVPFGREGMLAEAAKSKKRSGMTPAELAEESVNKHQAFLRHMAELSSTSRQSMWGGDDWAKPSGKAPYDPLHYTYGIGEKEEGHGPWHVTRHPETRDYQLVDNQNRLVQTIPSVGRSSYDMNPSNERSHAHQLWETVNVAHGHMDEPKDHEESFSKFYERPRPPFEHSPEDPKRAELNSRPEPRSYAPSGYEGPRSPGDHWNGPYEVVKHPETGKYHVMDGDGRHAGVLPRGGTDDHAHAQSRRDWIDGRMQSKERARGIADSIFNSTMDILDPGGTEESRRSDRNMRSMNALSHRYSDGLHHPLNPGHFGADDHEKDGDGEGDPYYEISDPGGSGWKARDYGGGQVRIHHAATGNEEHDMVDNSIHDHSTGNRVENPSYGHDELHQELHHWIHGDPNDDEDRYGHGKDYARNDPRISRWQKRNRYQASKRVAFGEVKAPMSVDTLRQTKCPVCGSDNSAFASGVCRVCGFVQPPAFLQDPDLDLAKQVDLRQDEAVDPGDLSMDGEVIQPPQGEPQPGQLDPDQLDEEGNPIEGDEEGNEQVDPSQIGEDGEIQGGVPGMPADGTPDLVCPSCGFTSDARPPQTTSLSGEYTDPGDDGTMEGDVCPNCQQAQLMSPQDQKDMQGPAA